MSLFTILNIFYYNRPDNWTAVTADGKRSAQFEHTLLVTEKGVDILTK
jgi:methionyl aminopeptidase